MINVIKRSVPAPWEAAWRGTLVVVLGLVVASCSRVEPPPPLVSSVESASMKRIRQIFARVPETLAKNHKVFQIPGGVVRGFGAGDAYPQIWLRDSAWIVPAASAYYEADTLTSWLDLHLSAAEKNGRLRDWVASAAPQTFREWAPRVSAVGSIAVDTNTNESDQEPGAALAYCRILEALGEGTDVNPSRERLVHKAIEALLRDRTDPRTGLVWSGLTADWGDVSPKYEDQRAIYLDEQTPRTLSLYTNVMVYAALQCLSSTGDAESEPSPARLRFRQKAAKLGDLIRQSFWMPDRGFFRVRRTLDPVPDAFESEEDSRFALGGNALAALFGVASDDQAREIFTAAERLRAAGNFSTISTTLIPPYAASVFLHPAMREPFQYQNGGQWDWFGALLVEAEFAQGHTSAARSHLDQIVARTLRAGPGLHEWYAQDGTPKGSGAYAASAATLHEAVVRGLLGVSRSKSGAQIVIRTRETLLPFELPHRATGEKLVLSQTVTTSAVEVRVQGDTRVKEVCSVLPAGRKPGDLNPERPGGFKQSVRTVGLDTLMCAEIAQAPLPVEVRFALLPS